MCVFTTAWGSACPPTLELGNYKERPIEAQYLLDSPSLSLRALGRNSFWIIYNEEGCLNSTPPNMSGEREGRREKETETDEKFNKHIKAVVLSWMWNKNIPQADVWRMESCKHMHWRHSRIEFQILAPSSAAINVIVWYRHTYILKVNALMDDWLGLETSFRQLEGI